MVHSPVFILKIDPRSRLTSHILTGVSTGIAKSRVATNRNLSTTLTMVEQKNCLVYAIDHGVASAVSSSDEDANGNIRLSKFFRKRLN